MRWLLLAAVFWATPIFAQEVDAWPEELLGTWIYVDCSRRNPPDTVVMELLPGGRMKSRFTALKMTVDGPVVHPRSRTSSGKWKTHPNPAYRPGISGNERLFCTDDPLIIQFAWEKECYDYRRFIRQTAFSGNQCYQIKYPAGTEVLIYPYLEWVRK